MRHKSNSAVRLTWEIALWSLVGLAALLLRFAQLDGAPLAAHEAANATAAWRAATGQGLPLVDYNPFLLAGNSLLFTLFGASDTLARLWPALFGSLLVLAPVLLRRSLGRVGALVAGAYLALSPTALMASRQLSGTTIAATGAMACAGGVVRFLETDRPKWLTLAAVGLGLGVSSGASVYGLLVPLGLAALLLPRIWPEDWTSGLVPDWGRLRTHGFRFFPVFVIAVLGFATGLGWNLPGVGGVGKLLAAWAGRFRPGLSPTASPLLLLMVYELLGLVFGLGGLVWGLLRGRRMAALLGLWVGLAGLLLALMPGRTPVDLLWLVVPLALLVGGAVDELARDRGLAAGALPLAYGGVVLVVWAHCYLMLARYATFGDRADLALALISIVLQGLLGLSFGLMLGADRTLRTAAVGTGVALLALMLAAGWGVAYRRPADPREALLREPTAVNVRDLVRTLKELSWRETGMPTTLAFVVEAPRDSVVAWYLREFSMARRVERLASGIEDDAWTVAVTTGRDGAPMASSGRSYAGQDFPLRRTWSPRSLDPRFWRAGHNVTLDWLLFREGIPLPEADRWATLWRAGEVSHSD